MKDNNKELIQQLKDLILKGNAHATLDKALENIPEKDRGTAPEKLPYSIWQLAEHIRLAQWDILGFSKDPNHKSPKWPDDFWPKEHAPENNAAWEKCIKQIKKDRAALVEMLEDENADLYTPFPHGDGQNLLREALLVADLNSYHTGEIILVRKLLGNWK